MNIKNLNEKLERILEDAQGEYASIIPGVDINDDEEFQDYILSNYKGIYDPEYAQAFADGYRDLLNGKSTNRKKYIDSKTLLDTYMRGRNNASDDKARSKKLSKVNYTATKGQLVDVDDIYPRDRSNVWDSSSEETKQIVLAIEEAIPKEVGKFMLVNEVNGTQIFLVKSRGFGDIFWVGMEDGKAVKLGPQKAAELFAQL